MNIDRSPFKAGWWGFGTPGYPSCNGTYCLYSYDILPPLDAELFNGEFQWLTEQSARLQDLMSIYRPSEEAQQALLVTMTQLTETAQTMGLSLPKAFLHFMGSLELQNQIPSCTACYFNLSEMIIKSPLDDDEGYFIRFLHDQQDVLLWYLYVNPKGEHCVVVTPIWLEEALNEGVPQDVIQANIWFCAPEYEEFIYRFWLENTLWFAADGSDTLADDQKAYIEYLETHAQ